MSKSKKNIAKSITQKQDTIYKFGEVFRRSECMGALAIAAQHIMAGDVIADEMARDEVVGYLHEAIDLISEDLSDFADLQVEAVGGVII